MKKYNVGVIGVGAVGVELLRILRERKFPIKELRVFARSARAIHVDGRQYNVAAISDEDFDGIEIALFAGTEGEKGAANLYAGKFVERGAVVIDNGADFRLQDDVPLIVPEANRDKIKTHKGIIANPNCTTIQALVALAGIQKTFGLEKFILTSFQATSGAGRGAALGLWEETKELAQKNRDCDFSQLDKRVTSPCGFTHQIAYNVIPQIGGYGDDNYTSEEWKVVRETHKIFDDASMKISATCVRVPVFTSHSEAIYFTLRRPVPLSAVADTLRNSEGVIYDPQGFALPLDVEGTEAVYVARLRRDPYDDKSFWLWCVADNLRKGAALNAVQIAEDLIRLQS